MACSSFSATSLRTVAVATVAVMALLTGFCHAYEYTFELPDNEKMCFHEVLKKDVKCVLEFQVITGGNYDVDLEIMAPGKEILYKEMKKQYDNFKWTTKVEGEFSFCFSNEFSTFTHKLVYFDFQAGDDDPVRKAVGEHASVLTQMETSSAVIHDSMKTVIDYQTHHRLREAQGEVFAWALNSWVLRWSVGQTMMILAVGIGQVLVLRSFFTDRIRRNEAIIKSPFITT
jgi:protein ERP2